MVLHLYQEIMYCKLRYRVLLSEVTCFFVYSFFSEILFCSFGIMPFVTLIVVGVCSFGGTISTPSIIDKV